MLKKLSVVFEWIEFMVSRLYTFKQQTLSYWLFPTKEPVIYDLSFCLPPPTPHLHPKWKPREVNPTEENAFFLLLGMLCL